MIKKKIVLLGKGELAIRVAEYLMESSKYELSLVVPVYPEPIWTSSLLEWAMKRGIPTIPSGNYQEIGSKKIYDIYFSVYYDKIFSPSFCEEVELILNLHNGPLPRYRGVNPINWALKNGEKEHGVTIHRIVPGVDEGAIFGQIFFPIYPNSEDVIDVLNRSYEKGYELFKQVFEDLETITPIEQDHRLSFYYSKAQFGFLGEFANFKRDKSINN